MAFRRSWRSSALTRLFGVLLRTATAVNLNSTTVTDGAGNNANLSLTGRTRRARSRHHNADGVVGSGVTLSGDLDAGNTTR